MVTFPFPFRESQCMNSPFWGCQITDVVILSQTKKQKTGLGRFWTGCVNSPWITPEECPGKFNCWKCNAQAVLDMVLIRALNMHTERCVAAAAASSRAEVSSHHVGPASDQHEQNQAKLDDVPHRVWPLLQIPTEWELSQFLRGLWPRMECFLCDQQRNLTFFFVSAHLQPNLPLLKRKTHSEQKHTTSCVGWPLSRTPHTVVAMAPWGCLPLQHWCHQHSSVLWAGYLVQLCNYTIHTHTHTHSVWTVKT